MRQRMRHVGVGGGRWLVLCLCTGLFVALGAGAAVAQSIGGSAELVHVPSDARIVTYANVREVMLSDLWARLRQIAGDDMQELRLEQLGLDLERDIDTVLAFLAPGATLEQPAGLALLRGRFDMTRLEAVAREAGATVTEHAEVRVLSIEAHDAHDVDDARVVAVAALEPGLVAFGDLATVHRAIERQSDGSDVTANDEMMALLDRVEGGSQVWAVGRLGDLGALGILPISAPMQLPAVTAFALGGRVDSGVRGSVSIEGRDEETGQHLRDLLRGVLALAQSQTTAHAELQSMVDSVELGGIGTTATVSFSLPSEALDLVFARAEP